MLAHGRLADVQLLGSAAKARLLGNGPKNLNPIIFKHG
jgi:hypothetical protein